MTKTERVYFYCEKGSSVHYFHFEQVDGTPRLADSFALRFQVYCNECDFLPASNYPDGREQDEFDAHSSHFIGVHVNGELAGTARLVRSPLDRLPLSTKCRVDSELLPAGLSPDNAGEISRLAVSKNFRRRASDGRLPDTKRDTAATDQAPAKAKRRRACPELVLGLYKVLYQHSKRTGIEYWFAAMESSLARLLNWFHFEFRPVGPEVDYYGPVRPYVASLADLEAAVQRHAPNLFAEFIDGLEPEYLPPVVRTEGEPVDTAE